MKDRIRQIRKHFNLKQSELAETIGATAGYISQVELGRCGLSDENVEKICKNFHISSAWLRDGVDPMLSEDPASWEVPHESEEEKKERIDAIVDRIKQIREMNHFTQTLFGESLGVSRMVIGLVEQRRNDPSENLLKKIERVYNINPKWLRKGVLPHSN